MRPITRTLKLLLFVFILFLISPHPAFSQNTLTEKQQTILRQTMSVGGKITKQMHQEFWNDISKNTSDDWDPISLWLLESVKLSQKYQRELWQSALLSYEQNEVVKTLDLEKLELELSTHAYEEPPFEKGTPAYKEFIESYEGQRKISNTNADKLLQAAASHNDIEFQNGEKIKITDSSIRVILDGMDSGFQRLKILINPIWTGLE
jgi:hypothetical protein